MAAESEIGMASLSRRGTDSAETSQRAWAIKSFVLSPTASLLPFPLTTSIASAMNILYALSLALVGYWATSLYSAHARRTRERRYRLEQRRKAGIPDSDRRPFDVARADVLRRRDEERARRIQAGSGTSPGPFTSSIRKAHQLQTPQYRPAFSAMADVSPSPNPYIPVAASTPLPLSTSNLRQATAKSSVKRGIPSTFSDAALPVKVKKEAAALQSVSSIIRDIPSVGSQRKRRPAESIDGDEQQPKRSRQDDGSDDDGDDGDSEMLSVISDEDGEGDVSMAEGGDDAAYPHGLKRTLASAAITDDSPSVDIAKQRRADVAKRLKSTHAPRRRERSSTPASSSPPPSKRAYTPSSPYRPSTLASKHTPASAKSKRTVDTSDDHELGSEWTDLNGLRWQMGEDGVARREAEYYERLPRFEMPKDSLHPDRDAKEWKKVRGWVDEERFEELKRAGLLGWQGEAAGKEEEEKAAAVTPSRAAKPRRSVDPGALFSVAQGPPLRFSPAIAASPSPSRAASPAGGRLPLSSTSTPTRSRLGTPRSAMLDQAQKARREETIMGALRRREEGRKAAETIKPVAAPTAAVTSAAVAPVAAPAPISTTGSATSSTAGFSFSAAKTEPSPKPAEAAKTAPTFSFGASKSDEAKPAQKPAEAEPSSSLFTFGAAKPAAAPAETKPAGASTFSFGAPAAAAATPSAPSSSAPSFTFGAAPAATSKPAAAPVFTFGAK